MTPCYESCRVVSLCARFRDAEWNLQTSFHGSEKEFLSNHSKRELISVVGLMILNDKNMQILYVQNRFNLENRDPHGNGP